MRRRWAVVCVVAVAGCSSPPPPAPPAAEGASDVTAAATQGGQGLEMSGIKLYLYDKAAVPGQERSPALSVEADKFSQDEDKTWRFTKAHAVVHAKQAGEDNIVFDAGSGELREEESALLDQGVKATVGPMTIDMASVHWKQGADGTPGMASSDQPVTVLDPTMQLFAQQFRLYPDDSQFALIEVHGEVAFAAPPTEGAPAEAAPAPAGEVTPQ